MADDDISQLLKEYYGESNPDYFSQTKTESKWPSAPKLYPDPTGKLYRGEMATPERPSDSFAQPMAEMLSPTMGAYGAGDLLAQTYGNLREGNWNEAAKTGLPLAGLFAGVGARIAGRFGRSAIDQTLRENYGHEPSIGEFSGNASGAIEPTVGGGAQPGGLPQRGGLPGGGGGLEAPGGARDPYATVSGGAAGKIDHPRWGLADEPPTRLYNEGANIGTIPYESDPKAFYLDALRTDPEKRGQGYARGLMQGLIQKADARGQTLRMNPDATEGNLSNADLFNFYRSLGFEFTDNPWGDIPYMERRPDPYRAIPGIPTSVRIPGHGDVETRPVPWLVDAANAYMRGRGATHEVPEAFGPLDKDRGARIAQAYEDMQNDPTNPEVRRSYDALSQETLDQYRRLKEAGAHFQFNKPGEDPYKASPAMGYPEMRDQRSLSIFPTAEGYGNAFTPVEIANNPLLKGSGEKFGDQPATINDIFRAVHDAYGHYTYGNPFFRAPGEERAWMLHSGMYSPEARGAMTTELRGQNNWVNFGPHGEHNKTASGADTIFAPQKIGLLPPWASEEGRSGITLDEAQKLGLIDQALRHIHRAYGGGVDGEEDEDSFDARALPGLANANPKGWGTSPLPYSGAELRGNSPGSGESRDRFADPRAKQYLDPAYEGASPTIGGYGLGQGLGEVAGHVSQGHYGDAAWAALPLAIGALVPEAGERGIARPNLNTKPFPKPGKLEELVSSYSEPREGQPSLLNYETYMNSEPTTVGIPHDYAAPNDFPAREKLSQPLKNLRHPATKDRLARQALPNLFESPQGGLVNPWYYPSPLLDMWNRHWGEEHGETELGRFIDYVAATSPLTDVGTNIREASVPYSLHHKGERFNDTSLMDISGLAAKVKRNLVSNVAAGVPFDSSSAPKVGNYRGNLRGAGAQEASYDAEGNRIITPITLDTVMARTWPYRTQQGGQALFKKGAYGAGVNAGHALAEDLGGVPGADWQAGVWQGEQRAKHAETSYGARYNDSFARQVEDAVNQKAARESVDAQRMWEDVVLGRVKLFGDGGTVEAEPPTMLTKALSLAKRILGLSESKKA